MPQQEHCLSAAKGTLLTVIVVSAVFKKECGKIKLPLELNLARSRTDDDFRQQSDPNHHVAVSPLAVLPLGLISQFPLDYMHVVCLGVVRRVILLWSSGPSSVRLSHFLAVWLQ